MNDPDSPLHGQVTPDLQGKFVRGLEDVAAVLSAGPYGFGAGSPQTGGQDSASTAHAHGLPNHDHGIEHTHSVSDHSHGFSFSATGRTGGANQNPPQDPVVSARTPPTTAGRSSTSTT